MKKVRHCFGIFAAALVIAIVSAGQARIGENTTPDDQRKLAQKHEDDGNHKDAYAIWEQLVLDPDADSLQVNTDLLRAVSCLRRLNRRKEVDAFREKVIDLHGGNWRLLQAAAQTCFNGQHHGTIIAGEFERGHHRGGGRYVNSAERDRVRALQLMEQALPLLRKGVRDEQNPVRGTGAANFYLDFAQFLLGYRSYHESWRLQYLTDLGELPDYEEGHRYYHGGTRGAPVDRDGAAVLHAIPKSYEDAATDGERWRWMLVEAVEANPDIANRVHKHFADFLYNQFGVQTMAYYGRYFAQQQVDEKADTGTFALHTLGKTETIARLATGIKRFDLADEYSYIRIFDRIAQTQTGGYQEQCLNTLASLFENRRQYKEAARYWNESIRRYGPGHHNHKQKKLDQILKNWGRFDPVTTHPAGKKATVEYIFRNGGQVAFTAHRIKVDKILADVKDYLKSDPRKLDWQRMRVGDVGYMLVTKNQEKYLDEKVADWELQLEPRENHFDKRITITAPLKDAGAYLLTARMQDGNVSKIVIWIDDTVIARKQLDERVYFFVADAVTGKPIPKANVEFFGYRQERAKVAGKVVGRRYNVITSNFAELTDESGQAMPSQKDLDRHFQWLITARTDDGRLAYLGFTGVWYANYHDREYNETKVYTVTDRPVYRPKQPVKFKFWVRHAKYDREDSSTFAGRSFNLRIYNPKREKILEQSFKADAYGGFHGEYMLPGDATLGVYQFEVSGYGRHGTFRVEEYKKPEYEVTIDAPTEPIMLGEKITATVKAKYYFGAPVTEAKVKYKVLRSAHSANWFPPAPWDWFYGPGYWWFAYDYDWYPGWHRWGCFRPWPWWWPQQRTPPETVAEGEAKIGKDGTFDIDIDTLPAKELHGDTDHRYELTAEITDKSRRTIVGTGRVLVARRPFKVYAWLDRGYYRSGDTVRASFSAQTLDNKPVKGKGELALYRITYKDGAPVEKAVEEWELDTDEEGRAALQFKAARAGQYRLSYTVTDSKDHEIEGAYVFVVRGEAFDDAGFRFNHLELVTEKREYAPGETVKLAINTEQEDSTVVLFVRPANGVYLPPEVLSLDGKSTIADVTVTKKDMPNFFVEAMTVVDGKLHTAVREIIVPPEKRVLNVDVLPSSESYKPGQKATIKVRITDFLGEPFAGSAVMSVYDKSVEYISGGSNVSEIKQFFWKWRRRHNPSTSSSLDRRFGNMALPGAVAMSHIGVFGHSVADDLDAGAQDGRLARSIGGAALGFSAMGRSRGNMMKASARTDTAVVMEAAAPMAMAESAAVADLSGDARQEGAGAAGPPGAMAEAVVRKEFADTAFWAPSLETDANGIAEVTFDMPENLTGWKIRTWAMGHGTTVGEGTAEVVTSKNLLLRLQAPRFFVEKDEVVLSANVHNYLDSDKTVQAVLELDGPCLEVMGKAAQTVKVAANGEERVDWRVKVTAEGEAIVRMKALTDEESDAMQMAFPVYVHGMLKMDSYCGVIRREEKSATVEIEVPAQRRVDQSRLEVRYSPTLAGAMVDALPYLAEYPYGCTEQTLNRFVPTVITQKILREMGLDLAEIAKKRTNLNAQEIGDDKERAAQWKRWDRNPVFDKETLDDMVKQGLKRLTAMQLSDGGWGWFSGWGEHSYPHTTAVVVHGLQTARDNDMAIVPGVIDRGIQWLERHRDKELKKLKNAPKKRKPWKNHADNTDALVNMVLTDEGKPSPEMRDFLYRDRNTLAVYGKSMLGIALHKEKQEEKLAMVMRNIGQYLVRDDENQTAWLNLGNRGYWWYWYGSEYEAHAYYLKLLSLTDPKGNDAAGLVKYLLNNRKHATYWNSTRDTALCVEAFADYLRASGEGKPDMTVTVSLDGRKHKEVRITAENLFTFDNALVLEGDEVASGKHKVTLSRTGSGPLYFNAYLTSFTLEDYIKRTGLEIKVNRKLYKLVPVDKTIKVAGSRGQALDQKVEKYERVLLNDLDVLKSGDLVEIELEIESKNDYEYIIFEDMKAAGFEPVDVRSGYTRNDMHAYVEFRDERVAFFIRALARGRHSVSYRTRAEIPGRFSALPTRAYAMYAPELKANSDEIKLNIED